MQWSIKLFFVLCLLLTKPLAAQVYEPAFIISIYGDTIRCQLKHIKFITNKTEFMYKLSLEDKKELYINSKDVLWIVTPKDTFECLSIDKGLYKGQVYAYRLLTNGHLRLYAQDRYIKTGGEASDVYFLKKEGKLLQEISMFDYKKYLLAYTEDNPEFIPKITRLIYSKIDLIKVIKEYNDWFLRLHNK
ncbi:MAG: hypothetical protein JWO58_98 [Chitinophagaceae bacterium]|nr:hypothetical protein [Chitinophagaceae bacterium]